MIWIMLPMYGKDRPSRWMRQGISTTTQSAPTPPIDSMPWRETASACVSEAETPREHISRQPRKYFPGCEEGIAQRDLRADLEAGCCKPADRERYTDRFTEVSPSKADAHAAASAFDCSRIHAERRTNSYRARRLILSGKVPASARVRGLTCPMQLLRTKARSGHYRLAWLVLHSAHEHPAEKDHHSFASASTNKLSATPPRVEPSCMSTKARFTNARSASQETRHAPAPCYQVQQPTSCLHGRKATARQRGPGVAGGGEWRGGQRRGTLECQRTVPRLGHERSDAGSPHFRLQALSAATAPGPLPIGAHSVHMPDGLRRGQDETKLEKDGGCAARAPLRSAADDDGVRTGAPCCRGPWRTGPLRRASARVWTLRTSMPPQRAPSWGPDNARAWPRLPGCSQLPRSAEWRLLRAAAHRAAPRCASTTCKRRPGNTEQSRPRCKLEEHILYPSLSPTPLAVSPVVQIELAAPVV